ncbi:uncharacterized protein SPSC_01269 [Sporisorium scitamineum]|uniref:Reverse transcriptase domain-containing protein n=1 Tax=Sporisorium scitamineum TaxID=49012 RepID=A0A0F7SA96_9BASI|nr:uncharacterized protein SPSC_01269 [Sporisorium scitamineum]CDW99206.1 hypothetical protein [Sporisorium scitamineum]
MLTFGGSSSPWFFNLMAKFLHWLVAACIPPNWPFNHYLNDTFGTIPGSNLDQALLPVHTLALATKALGLHLLPKKTFGNITKLEILGVEVDLVAQTMGISNEHHAHILSQCCTLLQQQTANILDMQCMPVQYHSLQPLKPPLSLMASLH